MTTSRKKVLCVEDHPDTCELISTLLTDFEVISANSTRDAAELLKQHEFSLILLDYHLPDGTGAEFLARVREIDKATPAVFVTGTSSITEHEAIAFGAQALIRKCSEDFLHRLVSIANSLAVDKTAGRAMRDPASLPVK